MNGNTNVSRVIRTFGNFRSWALADELLSEVFTTTNVLPLITVQAVACFIGYLYSQKTSIEFANRH